MIIFIHFIFYFEISSSYLVLSMKKIQSLKLQWGFYTVGNVCNTTTLWPLLRQMLVQLCTCHAGLAVGVHVEAVQVYFFPCGGATPLWLLLLQLGQCQRPDRVHKAFLIHLPANRQAKHLTSHHVSQGSLIDFNQPGQEMTARCFLWMYDILR